MIQGIAISSGQSYYQYSAAANYYIRQLCTYPESTKVVIEATMLSTTMRNRKLLHCHSYNQCLLHFQPVLATLGLCTMGANATLGTEQLSSHCSPQHNGVPRTRRKPTNHVDLSCTLLSKLSIRFISSASSMLECI